MNNNFRGSIRNRERLPRRFSSERNNGMRQMGRGFQRFGRSPSQREFNNDYNGFRN